ncbi:MAG TPA: UDP-N-acetylmuramoyl-tripeptide--D-alanyl-D-alanine ligase [Steroidobacteraceae bacterium]|nr:UDP-N-acetylmuramoyl-tripeptide--D-alanyl-D-alanine ligase [Steroidobacteraceae bacterium]
MSANATVERTLRNFTRACGGRLEGADRAFAGVSSDSRTLSAGDLFVALRGPRFNGSEFVGAAVAAGAAAALVDALQPARLAQIVVADTQAALSLAGHAWREGLDIPVIGVAGSNGKTTAKEMTAAILSEAGSTLATRGNLNNHIGVPLTLLRLERGHRYAVIEMGANRAAEVAELVKVARPTVGLITNAGAEHLEGFGSLEGVARAEGEMVAGLAADATAVINADDEFANLWRGMTSARVVTFGIASAADFRASDLRTTLGAGGFLTRFRLSSPLGRAEIELRLGGRHNVANALGAAAAAAAAGATLEQIVRGLGAMRAVPGRLQLKQAAGGAWIIDDSYNANPSSVHAGIEVLASIEGRRWLVLGEMAELGEFAAEAHAEIGAFAREHGVERLLATGPLAALAVERFGAGGQWFPDTEALGRELLRVLSSLPAGAGGSGAASVSVLVKGSRVARLERVVAALVGNSNDNADGH